MLQRKVTITREELHNMYWAQRKSMRQIAKLHGVTLGAVFYRMTKYGIPLRNKPKIRLTHVRKPFSGDKNEKAYLLGLRAGDIHARKRATNTIGVNVTTTHPAMFKLFTQTFGRYGRVKKYPVNAQLGYEWYVYCDLDTSFEFLIEKPMKVPNDDRFYAFLAGYVDSEGTWSFSRQVNKIVFHFWIKSQDIDLLDQIKRNLEKDGFHPSHLKLAHKGQHQHENSANENRIEIEYRRDYWQLRICRQNEIFLLAKKLIPFVRHEEKVKRMRLMFKAEEREWSKHGDKIKKLIAQISEEVKKWVKEAEIKYKQKHV